MIYLLTILILNSYVKLPEGTVFAVLQYPIHYIPFIVSQPLCPVHGIYNSLYFIPFATFGLFLLLHFIYPPAMKPAAFDYRRVPMIHFWIL